MQHPHDPSAAASLCHSLFRGEGGGGGGEEEEEDFLYKEKDACPKNSQKF